jgi:hypothetical protein
VTPRGVWEQSHKAAGQQDELAAGEKDIQYVLSGDKFVATDGSYTTRYDPRLSFGRRPSQTAGRQIWPCSKIQECRGSIMPCWD